jgi:hypothetical protein
MVEFCAGVDSQNELLVTVNSSSASPRLRSWAPHTRPPCFRSYASPRPRGLGAAHQVGVLPQLCQSSCSGARRRTPGRCASAALPVLVIGGWVLHTRSACFRSYASPRGGWAPHTRSACFRSSANPHPRGPRVAHQVGVLLQLCQSSSSRARHRTPGRCASTAMPVLVRGGGGLGAAHQVGVLPQLCQSSSSRAGRRISGRRALVALLVLMLGG